MKVFYTVLKVLAALAAVAGAVYVAVTYGDRILARMRNFINKYTKRFRCEDMNDSFVVDDAEFES